MHRVSEAATGGALKKIGVPMNFVKFLRTPCLQNTSKRLLRQCVDIIFDPMNLNGGVMERRLTR